MLFTSCNAFQEAYNTNIRNKQKKAKQMNTITIIEALEVKTASLWQAMDNGLYTLAEANAKQLKFTQRAEQLGYYKVGSNLTIAYYKY